MQGIGHQHYVVLLLAAVATLVCMALPQPFDFLAVIGFSVLILLQIRLLIGESRNAATSLVFRLLGWLTLGGLWLWMLTPSQLRLSGVPLLVMLTLFELQAYPRLVQRLSQEKRVTADVLTGALAGYVLLGLTAALVTAMIESIEPGSFRGLGTETTGAEAYREVRFIHVAYFAFVTLSTLGYGDVVPLTPMAKLSTILISLIGPSYLALVMGVLIGRYIHQESKEP